MSEPTHDPDRAALERVAEGDVESFTVLVERHEARLFRLCHRMLGDREEAREATQDAFLKAFRKAGSFEPRALVSTWLYRIATNGCLNRLRRRKIVRFFSFGDLAGGDARGGDAEDDPTFDPVDEAADPAERLASRRRWRRTRKRIDALPASQRAVLVLAKFEGLSYREIARALEITESAVESRLHRAMKKLVEADARENER